jgi:hypothetical protein
MRGGRVSGRSGLGLAAAGLVLLLPLAYSPVLEAPVWAPKAALVVVLAGIGVPLLFTERSRPSVLAAGFLGVAALSTATSDNPGLSTAGLWNWGTGLIFVGGCVGAWALGRRVNFADRGLLERTMVAAGLATALLTLVDVAAPLEAFGILPRFGQPTGLFGNPIYLAGSMLLPLGVAVHKGVRAPWWALAAGILAAAVMCTRTRAAIALVVIGALLQLRHGRKGVLPLVSVIVGLSAGVIWTGVFLPAVGADAPDAVAAASLTYSNREGPLPRLENWLDAPGAVLERPFLGAGPGRYFAATVPHRGLRAVRATGGDYYADAHNFVVEYAVTTGLIGLVLLLTWLAFSSVSARGPFALAALLGGLLHLIHPQNVATTPLVLLCLGAASLPKGNGASDQHEEKSVHPLPVGVRVLAVGSICVSLATAGAFLVGQVQLRSGYLDFDSEKGAAAFRLLPPWPEVAAKQAILAVGDLSAGESPNWPKARHYFRQAVRRDPQDPRPWVTLGDFEQARNRARAARAAYQEALRLDPWSKRALTGMIAASERSGLRQEASTWRGRLRELE